MRLITLIFRPSKSILSARRALSILSMALRFPSTRLHLVSLRHWQLALQDLTDIHQLLPIAFGEFVHFGNQPINLFNQFDPLAL